MNAIKQKLRTNLPQLKLRYPIAELAIFDSEASGNATANSDIDILVSFNASVGIEFIDLTDELEEIMGNKIDLITQESMKPRQREYIKNQLLYD